MELQIFQNSGFQIRGGLIDNEPYFVAKDVCDMLDYSNVSMTLSKLRDSEKGVKKIYTLGGEQNILHINESGR